MAKISAYDQRSDPLIGAVGIIAQPGVKNFKVVNDLIGGWIGVDEAWTYNAADAINVSTGATSRFQKGWGVRFKQSGGTYKYGYINPTAATILTLYAGSDYVVANEAITDIAISPNPAGAFGFPGYFTYPATIRGSAGSAGTYAETVGMEGKFSLGAGKVFVQANKRVTDKGSWSDNVQVILPIAGSSIYGSAFQTGLPAWYANGGLPSAPKAICRLVNSTTLSFLDAYNSSFFTWAELTTGDWLTLDISYWY